MASSSISPPLAVPHLEMQGIVKRYGATTALNGVDFDVQQGEIHALLGENGAGKSTLMHVLAGLTRPDAGQIRLEGQAVRVGSPRTARALGIAMVHQHFTLVPAFTVAENLALDAPMRGSGAAWRSSLRYSAVQRAQGALERARSLGWELSPDTRASDLSVGTQQRVEIVKALATDARLLIFDEPTAVLAGAEVDELFAVLRLLREQGHSIVLIAHKLAEILAVADRVTVLRRGNRVASALVRDVDAPQLAAWMVGVDPVLPSGSARSKVEGTWERDKQQEASAAPVLTASDLVVLGDRGEEAVRGLSLAVGRGEIFGIGGVDGNGQAELAEALVGLRPLRSGQIHWEGETFRPGVAPTVGYIPQDRRRSGLAVTMSVEDNLLFDAVQEPRFSAGPLLRRRALKQLAVDLVQQFDIRTPGVDLPVSALSGGNQQKIVAARAFRSQPACIVAVNPTRGLDISATRFVHEQLRLARDRGAAVVLISTDLDEIAALADRTAILSRGALTEARLETGRAEDIGLLLGGIGPAASVPGKGAAVSSPGHEEAH